MDRHIAYLEETLHVGADASKYNHSSALPLYLRNGFDLCAVAIQGVNCLLVSPKETGNLSVLRKHCIQLRKLTGMDCVLCLDSVRSYTKEKMLSEGIPFIVEGQQIYMPFLGIALAKNGVRDIPEKEQITFATQKLLITAVYDCWRMLTLTEAARVLGMSKMSVSRCFDEIQALGLPLVKSEGKLRKFIWESGSRALWSTVRPVMRNPVARQYGVERSLDIPDLKLGGISALCHYSVLTDESHTVYAISRDAAKIAGLNKLPVIPDDEAPDTIIQVIRYEIEYHDAFAIDPLTAILSLTDEDRADPRVEAAIEMVLEDCLHD